MRRLRPLSAGLLAVTVTGSLALAGSPLAHAAPRSTVGGDLLAQPGVLMQAEPGKTPKPVPAVSGAAWLVADADTGEILAAKNAHVQHLPASTLKTLTAVTLLDQLDPDDTYVPTYEDISVEGSKVGIVNGSRYTVDQLWYGLFLASGNDTASALARINGGMHKTVTQMNEKARELQANDTVAKNTSGLDADGQVSSAYDLALIARAGLDMPAFAKYCGTVSVKFPRAGTKLKRKTFMVYNHNPLVIGGYKGALGVKTGYTDLARRTFVGAAKQGGRTLIVTIMKYEGITYRTAEALLDWGFANATKVAPVGTLVDPLPAVQAEPAKAESTRKATAGISTNDAGGSMPLWPFLVVAAGLLGFVAWSIRGSRTADPLAAANKGLGGRGSRNSPGGPRGRGGPGSY